MHLYSRLPPTRLWSSRCLAIRSHRSAKLRNSRGAFQLPVLFLEGFSSCCSGSSSAAGRSYGLTALQRVVPALTRTALLPIYQTKLESSTRRVGAIVAVVFACFVLVCSVGIFSISLHGDGLRTVRRSFISTTFAVHHYKMEPL